MVPAFKKNDSNILFKLKTQLFRQGSTQSRETWTRQHTDSNSLVRDRQYIYWYKIKYEPYQGYITHGLMCVHFSGRAFGTQTLLLKVTLDHIFLTYSCYCIELLQIKGPKPPSSVYHNHLWNMVDTKVLNFSTKNKDTLSIV